MSLTKILILLSTYNGEKFIREQLFSILTQQGVDVHILIRDDGSKDNTCEIVEDIASTTDRITLIRAKNVGCIGSFCALAKEAYDKYKDFDLYAFADQDDVWMKNKLYRGWVELAGNQGDSMVRLYASAYQMTDSDLHPIPTRIKKAYKTFGESLVIQPVLGCTMIFTRPLLELFVKADSSLMSMHDSWMYKLCLGVGGVYIYDPVPSILYRQHGGNVIGGNQTQLQRWTRRWNNFIHAKRIRFTNATNFLSVYEADLTPENRKLLKNLVAASHSLFKRLKIFFSDKYKTPRQMSNILFKMAVLFDRY